MPKKEDLKGDDKRTSIATSRKNVFKSKQNEKNSVQNQDNDFSLCYFFILRRRGMIMSIFIPCLKRRIRS
jgi:hypothetical protein